MVDFAAIPSWAWWAGGTALAAGGYYLFVIKPGQGQAQDTTSVDGSYTGAYPSLTYAAPAALGGSGGSDITTGGSGGLDTLSNVLTALNQPTSTDIATATTNAYNSGVAAGGDQAGITAFTTLTNFLNQHKGLKNIGADIPGLGHVQVGADITKVIRPPPKVVTKTKVITKPAPKLPAHPAHVTAPPPKTTVSSHHVTAVKHK
jgi:hypothetical protein